MNTARILAIIGLIAMSSMIIYTLLQGNASEELSLLLSKPWGMTSVVDLYTGLIFFSGWVAFREKSTIQTAVWVFFLITLGFLTASIYILYALHQSHGNWQQFWMGYRNE